MSADDNGNKYVTFKWLGGQSIAIVVFVATVITWQNSKMDSIRDNMADHKADIQSIKDTRFTKADAAERLSPLEYRVEQLEKFRQ